MNILTDYLGHTDLYYSLHALFEKRLGGQLFIPNGEDLEWKNFFSFNPSIPVCEKLESDEDIIRNSGIECDKYEWINDIRYYYKKMEASKDYHCIQKAITLEKFLKMDIDIVVTTYWGHEEGAYNLVKKHKPNAILIRQIGNIGEAPTYCKNSLLAVDVSVPSDVNYIKYFPEHYEGYYYTPPTNHNTIKSFMNYLSNPNSYPKEIKLWNELKSLLPEFIFKMHGALGEDGSLPHLLMPQAMKNSAFIWHVKWGGGGFVARQIMACGRPIIINTNYCRLAKTLEEKCYKHKINCIDLSQSSIQDCANIIKEWSEPDRHAEICKTVAEEAKKDMNFEKEAEQIKAWIETLPRGVQ